MARLLFFGRISDVAENCDIELPATVRDTAQLRHFLMEKGVAPGAVLNSVGISVAVNQKIVTGLSPISNDDEIAFFSPMSGG